MLKTAKLLRLKRRIDRHLSERDGWEVFHVILAFMDFVNRGGKLELIQKIVTLPTTGTDSPACTSIDYLG